MALNFTFVKEHPYALGGLLLGGLLLFALLRSKASGAVTTTASAQSAGLPASVQQSYIQAGSALQLATLQQQQAAQDQQFQLALEAQKEAASTQQQVNAIQGAQNIATIQAGVETDAISTQAEVINHQTQAGLDTQLSHDALALSQSQIDAATSLGSAQIQAGQAVSLAQIAADRDQSIARTTTTAAVDLGALAANTQTVVAGYGRDVALAQIQGGVSLAEMQLQNQNDANKTILDLLKSGQLNKGGEGGANQLAAIASIKNQPTIAQAAYGTATASLSGGNSIGGIIGSLGDAMSKYASAVLG